MTENNKYLKNFFDYRFFKKIGYKIFYYNTTKNDFQNKLDNIEIIDINFDAENYDFKNKNNLELKQIPGRNKLQIWYINEEKYNIIEKKSIYLGLTEEKKKLNINYYHLKKIIIKLMKDKNIKKKKYHKLKLKYICDRTLFFFVFFYNYIKENFTTFELSDKLKEEKINKDLNNYEKMIKRFIEIDYDFNYIMEGKNYEGRLCDSYTVLDYLISDYNRSKIETKSINLKFILKFLKIINEKNLQLDNKIYYHFFYKFYKNFEDFDIYAIENRKDNIKILLKNNSSKYILKEKIIKIYKNEIVEIFNILLPKLDLFISYKENGLDEKYCFTEKYPIETLIISNTFKISESSLIRDEKFLNYIKENINNFVELIFYKTLSNIIKHFDIFVEQYWDYAYWLLVLEGKRGLNYDSLIKTFDYIDISHLNKENKENKEKLIYENIITTMDMIGSPPIEPESTEDGFTEYEKFKEIRYDYDKKLKKNQIVWTENAWRIVFFENEDEKKYNVGFKNAFQEIINKEQLLETYNLNIKIDDQNFIDIMKTNIKKDDFTEKIKEKYKKKKYFSISTERFINNIDNIIEYLIKKIEND